MIDLHSHFLPGVDDGAEDMSITVAMLKEAEKAGITHLLATPHINENSLPSVQKHIQDTFRKVQLRKESEGINIDLSLAGEVHFDGHFLEWTQVEWLQVGNRKKYLIFELPMQGLPLKVEDAIFQLGLKGITPVLAHPERNLVLQRDIRKVQKWIEQGCIMQLNAGSVLGHFGSSTREFAFQLLEQGSIHIACSDAHNVQRRGYDVLSRGYHEISERFGSGYADLLFTTNPRQILNDGNLNLPNEVSLLKDVSGYKKWLQKLHFSLVSLR